MDEITSILLIWFKHYNQLACGFKFVMLVAKSVIHKSESYPDCVILKRGFPERCPCIYLHKYSAAHREQEVRCRRKAN